MMGLVYMRRGRRGPKGKLPLVSLSYGLLRRSRDGTVIPTVGKTTQLHEDKMDDYL